MIAGQTGYGLNGKQNALFPLDCIYITQGENTGTSHVGMYAIDFVGWASGGGQIYQYPYYAPFDCKLLQYHYEEIVWESLDQVNRIDGSVGITTISFGHDNDRSRPVGMIKRQGELIGHTGTYKYGGGSVGDHVHMEVVAGAYDGWITTVQGYDALKGNTHIYNVLGVNDTTIYRGLGYNWRSFTHNDPAPSPPHPAGMIKGQFPWVLYARKLRTRQ